MWPSPCAPRGTAGTPHVQAAGSAGWAGITLPGSPPPLHARARGSHHRHMSWPHRLLRNACLLHRSIRVLIAGLFASVLCSECCQSRHGRQKRHVSASTSLQPSARCVCDPGWIGFDCAGYFLSASDADGHTDERGGTAGFTLALARRPLGVVTCALAVTDASEGSVPPVVEITPDNWRAAEVGTCE